jgi:hypothetical protein
METALTDNAAAIASANDEFRRAGWGFMLTVGVQGLEDVVGLVEQVRSFSVFTEENDPYGEHDFGSFTWYGEKVYWKIDYYDQTLSGGMSPLSPDCRRILTIMLASEY